MSLSNDLWLTKCAACSCTAVRPTLGSLASAFPLDYFRDTAVMSSVDMLGDRTERICGGRGPACGGQAVHVYALVPYK
jgi:hypothetical protein